nr:unnamed protein product [Callosobruchus chinensis]
MHTRNFFFSPQGGRSSYFKNLPHLYPQAVQGLECIAWRYTC